MSAAKRQYWLIPAAGIVGLVLLCVGVSFLWLSNPNRFPSDAIYDREIGLYRLSGFALTIVGVVVVLLVARRTATNMPPETRRKASVGVGAGVLLQSVGAIILRLDPDVPNQFTGLAVETQTTVQFWVAALILAVSLPVFVWGCGNYAQGKRYSSSLGVLGVLGVLGLIVLLILPPVEITQSTGPPHQGDQPEDKVDT